MRSFLLRSLVGVLLSFSASLSFAQARQRIVIDNAGFRAFPVAAPELVLLGGDPVAGTKWRRDLSAVLQNDVAFVRALSLIPPNTYLKDAKENWLKPKYPNWLNTGASGLIYGGVEALANGKIKLSLRFYDVIAQRELLAKTYTVTNKKSRKAIHSFVDDIVFLLSGERGILNSKITFVKGTNKGKAVYIADADGQNAERLTDPAVISLLPAWGPSGESILFTSYLKNNPDLFEIDLSNKKLNWLSNKTGLNTGATTSPDNKKIALTLSVDGNTEIYVMNADGSNLRRLTNNWGQDTSPSFSPDGKKIAFVSSRSGNPHIYVMNADGSSPKRLTFQGKYNQEPDWSSRADGQIAFTARDERNRFDIFLVNPSDGKITRLTQDQGDNEQPSYSPDGQHILFVSTRPPKSGKKLYVMDVDGDNQRRISVGGQYFEDPDWGPRFKGIE